MTLRLRDGAAGEHEYTIQGEFDTACCGVDVLFSRIIAEWTG